MAILIGLIPALAWGLLPISIAKTGGKPANQILGTTAGTLIIALALLVFTRHVISARTFILSFLSGALWVVGQLGQYQAYTRLGVSGTMPVSTGLQLTGTSLIGVFVFGEWPGIQEKLIGFSALAIVIIGIYLTSLKRKTPVSKVDKKSLLILVLTTLGYLAYSSIPKITDRAGTAIFFPQALGMFIAANIYILFSRQTPVYRAAVSWKNMLSGVLFSIGALAYILSAHLNGIATGFVLSQLCVVVSTIGGIVILREQKTRVELAAAGIGLGLIILGSAATAFL
ncbi:GRP family sugar transporter [Brucepastera parasyntrophica]|uniref:GRP family sugar transporter n=1 Tax=Brucepastera parasyntrophica TaxID=2880008 RepID=UPI00210952AB|nr:GRP family sugar transporter [Brucepastera parasyntrophica]ULQ58561.1 GRP family sugar transporter [Brucepastera parasyntrophica]